MYMHTISWVVKQNGTFTSYDGRRSIESVLRVSKWCFTHTPVSPYNSKANGKVESAVKMAKNLFRKAREDKADQYLAMLDHRNTPAKGLLSPAQKLMSRRTKTLLPTREDLFKPELSKNLKKLVKRDSRRQERSFNHFNHCILEM